MLLRRLAPHHSPGHRLCKGGRALLRGCLVEHMIRVAQSVPEMQWGKGRATGSSRGGADCPLWKMRRRQGGAQMGAGLCPGCGTVATGRCFAVGNLGARRRLPTGSVGAGACRVPRPQVRQPLPHRAYLPLPAARSNGNLLDGKPRSRWFITWRLRSRHLDSPAVFASISELRFLTERVLYRSPRLLPGVWSRLSPLDASTGFHFSTGCGAAFVTSRSP